MAKKKEQPATDPYVEPEDTALPLEPRVVVKPLGVNQDDGSWTHD